ncbi:hypothetical protein Bca101_098799 [Brassica carinata]
MMDFHGMKRRKLQGLCKKHGIPANLKNIEMANRLTSLFTDQTTPVRTQTMSNILSRCSVIENQPDGASADDEALVTSEYNTENSTVEEEMEISQEGCMSVGHCVSNPESELGMPNEMELSANRHGDLSEEQADICKVGRLSVGHCVNRETLDEVSALSQHVPVNNAASSVLEDEDVFTTPERKLMMMGQLSQNGKTLASKSVNHHSEEAGDSHGVVFTTPEQVLLMGDSGREEVGKQEEHTATESPVESDVLNNSQNEGVSVKKPAQFDEELGLSTEMHKAPVEFPDESDVPNIPERHPFSELEEAARSEEKKALELQVDCDNFVGANKNAKCHDMSDVVTVSESQSIMGEFEPHTAEKQERKEVDFSDESAFFTRFETCLLLGEPTQERPGNSKSGSSQYQSHHDSSLDLGENTIADSNETEGAENVAGLDATQGTSKKSKGDSPHVDSLTDIEGADTIMECNPESELFVETTPSPSLVQLAASLPTGPILVNETISTLATEEDAENNEESVLKEHSFIAKLAEATEAVLENSDVFTTPERNLMMMEQVSQNEKTLAADSVNHHSDEAVVSHGVVFTTPEQGLFLGDYWIDEVGKKVDCDNITGAYIAAKSHDISDVVTASESQFIMGDFEPEEAENKQRENKDVELLGESNIITKLEGHTLSEDSGLGKTRMIKYSTAATGKESFVFSSPEKLLHLEKSEPHAAGNQEREEVESAFFTRFETCLLLGESAHDILEESSPFTTIHEQINDALEELAITDELIETKVTTQRDDKGSPMLDSSVAHGG